MPGDPGGRAAGRVQPRDRLAAAQHPRVPVDEELALLRDWWPDLVEMYSRTATASCVVACEV